MDERIVMTSDERAEYLQIQEDEARFQDDMEEFSQEDLGDLEDWYQDWNARQYTEEDSIRD